MHHKIYRDELDLFARIPYKVPRSNDTTALAASPNELKIQINIQHRLDASIWRAQLDVLLSISIDKRFVAHQSAQLHLFFRCLFVVVACCYLLSFLNKSQRQTKIVVQTRIMI